MTRHVFLLLLGICSFLLNDVARSNPAHNESFFTLVTNNGKEEPSPLFQANIPSVNGTLPCTCGIPDVSDRIVGGSPVWPPHKYPWVVAVVLAKQPKETYCGGALISPRYVVSAYHCFEGKKNRDFRIRIGIFDLSEALDTPGTYFRKILRRKDPSQARGRTDFTVIQLDKSVSCGPKVRPICLPSQGTNFAGRTGDVAGWGATAYEGNGSRFLQSVRVPVASTEQCKKNYAMIYMEITKSMLCAGTLNGTKDACQGDSGGPLMCLSRNRQRWQLAGLVSEGTRCATKGFYGLYTNVSFYTNYIRRSTGNTATIG